MSGFKFVVAYLLLSALVLWGKEIKAKFMAVKNNIGQNGQEA